MSLKKAAGIGLMVLGAALIPVGIAIDSRDNVGIEGVRFFAIYLGGALAIGGLVLLIGQDIALIPWRPERKVLRCYVAGVSLILMSLFPLSLAIRDADYRVVSLASFAVAIAAGVGFLMAGRRFQRRSGGD